MAEDVGEAGVKVTLNVDVGDLDVRRICRTGNLLDCLSAVLNDVLGIALDEDFADVVGLGELSTGREVRRVVRLGKG